MTIEHFYRQFANSPISNRLKTIDIIHNGEVTTQEIYQNIDRLNNAMRPMRIEMDEWLSLAEKAEELKLL